MKAKFNVPDMTGLTIDMDGLEADLKARLNEIAEKWYEIMKAEIEVGTGASQQAFKYFFYDDGDSSKAFLLELDPSGRSHHQNWFGAWFQEVGSYNRVKKPWMSNHEEEFRAEVRAAINEALKGAGAK